MQSGSFRAPGHRKPQTIILHKPYILEHCMHRTFQPCSPMRKKPSTT